MVKETGRDKAVRVRGTITNRFKIALSEKEEIC